MAQRSFKNLKKKIKYSLLNSVVNGAIAFSNMMGYKQWLYVCGKLGSMVPLFDKQLKGRVMHHLTMAYGRRKTKSEIAHLTKKVFLMLGKNAGLVLKNFSSSPSSFYQHCVTHGTQYAEEAYQSGRGVIFLTAHLGPFEYVAHDLSLRGYHPFIIGTPLKDALLNKLLVNNRTKFGAVAIERGKETYRMMKNITAGGTMAILIDQDTRVKSVFVDFFEMPCATPVGATVLALKTGAAIIPVFAHLNADDVPEIQYYPEVTMKVTGNEEADLITNTQKLTNIIESEIRKFPEQWVWMHKRWQTTPKLVEEMAIA